MLKKFLGFAMYTLLLVIALSFNACQSEDPFEPQTIRLDGNLTATSSEVVLMQKMVSNDGSHDNIVDGSSCFDITFPYTVAVNEIEVIVDSSEDLDTIEEIFDAFEFDEDILRIIFPISITTADYTEITIGTEEDLNTIISQCIEGGDDDDIECIDLIYPVKLFKYDTESEITNTISVNNDKELRRFFAGLTKTSLISLEFPVMFELHTDEKITVSSNSELASAIEQAIETCDEDDDNDFNDDDFGIKDLEEWLTKCEMRAQWQFEQDKVPSIAEYLNFSLWFDPLDDGSTINVFERDFNSFFAQYSFSESSDGIFLEIVQGPIPELNRRWSVNKISENEIRLTDSDAISIVLNNTCEEIVKKGLKQAELLEKLTKNSWLIESYLFTNEKQIDKIGNEFVFEESGSVSLYTNEAIEEGSWQFSVNDEGFATHLEVSIGQDERFNFTYPLTDVANNRLIYGNYNDSENRLILQETGNSNTEVALVLELLRQGEWKTTALEKDGFSNLEGIQEGVYDFSSMNRFEAIGGLALGYTSDDRLSGRFSVVENREYDLDLYMNLGGNQTELGVLTDVWTIYEYSANRIDLKSINDDGSFNTMVLENQ